MRQRLSSMGVVGWAAALGTAALLMRLPFLFGTHHVEPGSDESAYLALTHGLFHGKGFQGQHFWTPGYPALEGLLELLPGRTDDVLVVAQHLLGVAVVVAIVVASWRFFGRAPALVAGALAAVSPIMVVHERAPRVAERLRGADLGLAGGRARHRDGPRPRLALLGAAGPAHLDAGLRRGLRARVEHSCPARAEPFRVQPTPTEGALMAKVVHCPCGTDVKGETDDELVAAVEQHVQEHHPDQVGSMSREDIIGMAHEH